MSAKAMIKHLEQASRAPIGTDERPLATRKHVGNAGSSLGQGAGSKRSGPGATRQGVNYQGRRPINLRPRKRAGVREEVRRSYSVGHC